MIRIPKRNVDGAATLRKAIETGHFLPGQRLPEIELSEWMGINRVNVKLALAKLEQEGLVEIEANKGARVRVVTELEAIEILQTHASLETLLARNAAAKATANDRKRLQDILVSIKEAQAQEAYAAFSKQISKLHTEIGRIAAHATASRIVSTLNVQLTHFKFRAVLFPGRIEQSVHEFEEIVDAICAADGVRAGRAMLEHLNNVARALEENLSRSVYQL